MEELETKLKACHQEHLLKYYHILNPSQQAKFLNQLQSIKFEEVEALFKNAINSLNSDVQKLDDLMKPLPDGQFESKEHVDAVQIDKYRNRGFEEISEGRVAALLLAGGQGTRLGVPYPKGMYSVGLPSNKTLFQIQAERIKKVLNLAKSRLGKAKICWYIMTSGPTDQQTIQFLNNHNYFGLSKEDVVLFKQGLLPCFDFNGKILLEGKDQVALAPDGNGGLYRAMAENNIIEDMEKRGIKYLHVYSVDNILIKIADPVFIGYCAEKQADCANKVVKKTNPSEPIGVVCRVNGFFKVVEYSEINSTTANLRNEKGDLLFSAGNVCNHLFTVDFLKKVIERHEQELLLHVAKKKIPCLNEEGEEVKPKEPNGIKIEKFIFDVFPFSSNFVTWEVPREEEFSPMKNSDDAGKDCPATARRDLLALHKMYVERAGGKVLEGVEVEVSPLLSYEGEGLDFRGKEFFVTEVLEEEQLSNGVGITNGCC